MSKLTLLVFVASLLACTYAATKVTNDPIPISAIPPPWYMIPVHPNKQGVSLYGDGTSLTWEDRNKGLIASVFNFVYSYTLQPVVDIISSALSVVFGPLNYLGSFIGLSKVPSPEKQRMRRQAGSEPEAETELQTDLESDPELTAVQEDIDMDFLTDLAMISIQFILNTYEYIMAWVEVVIETLDADNGIDFNQLFELSEIDLDEVMDYLINLVQEIAIKISARLWMVIKSDLLPILDDAVMELQDSNLFSDDIKQMMLSLHSAYQMAHLLDVL